MPPMLGRGHDAEEARDKEREAEKEEKDALIARLVICKLSPRHTYIDAQPYALSDKILDTSNNRRKWKHGCNSLKKK